MRGKFIAIYGINNIGKSTQCRLLCESLKRDGAKIQYLKYPLYELPPSGPYLNSLLRDPALRVSETELQLWFALNRHQYDKKLREILENGTNVLAEDYVGTGIAWGEAKGLEIGWLEKINQHLLKPDLEILLEGRRYLRAKEKDHLHEEDHELIEKCRLTHQKLATMYGWKQLSLADNVDDSATLLRNLVDDLWR